MPLHAPSEPEFRTPGPILANSATPERESTDEGLRTEREKTDQVVEENQGEIARHADAVVDRARDNADEVLGLARENADNVLEAAREKADGASDPGIPDAQAKSAVIEERVSADKVLRDERDSADETLRMEREEHARALKRFLPHEREATDRYLLTERLCSDDALANRDDFLAIVAHDLRDLVGGVAMSAAVISKTASPNAEGESIRTETGRIERYAARISRLIEDLVDVASIDAGKLAVTPKTEDLAVLIAEAVDTFGPTAAEKGISLVARIDAAPLLAPIDHLRIFQVLANLLSNSLKFTPRGGEITIHGAREAGNVRLCVEDSGSGIPDHALERIFERFTQVGLDRRGSLGLGLYISRTIIEAHGGQIRAESKPGAGCKMWITLPAFL